MLPVTVCIDASVLTSFPGPQGLRRYVFCPNFMKRIEISKINSDMISLEKQISDVAEGLKDVVTKSELADMMNSFISDDDEKWLMFNAKFSSADEVYESIYRQAKSSI